LGLDYLDYLEILMDLGFPENQLGLDYPEDLGYLVGLDYLVGLGFLEDLDGLENLEILQDLMY
jgi:hypothetical protein